MFGRGCGFGYCFVCWVERCRKLLIDGRVLDSLGVVHDMDLIAPSVDGVQYLSQHFANLVVVDLSAESLCSLITFVKFPVHQSPFGQRRLPFLNLPLHFVSPVMDKIKFELIIGLSPCTGREAGTVYPYYPAAELRGILFIVSVP